MIRALRVSVLLALGAAVAIAVSRNGDSTETEGSPAISSQAR